MIAIDLVGADHELREEERHHLAGGSAPTAGTLAIGGSFSGGGGSIQPGTDYLVQGTHTYAQTGTYMVKITVLDTATGNSTVSESVVKATIDALSVTSTFPVPATAGVDTGSIVLGNFSDDATSNGVVAASYFNVSIDWGDGSAPTAGEVMPFFFSELMIGTDEVYGDHTYAYGGTYTIQVTVGSVLGGQASFTTTATVAGNPPPSPTPTPGPLSSAPLALPTVKPGVATSLKLGTVTALDTLPQGRPVDRLRQLRRRLEGRQGFGRQDRRRHVPRRGSAHLQGRGRLPGPGHGDREEWHVDDVQQRRLCRGIVGREAFGEGYLRDF